MGRRELPIPPHFYPEKVGDVWKVPYQERAQEAEQWARQHEIPPAADDKFKIALLGVDVQNTFCIPGYELFVGGASGQAAVDDNVRLCEFIYRNLGAITQISVTMDTHDAIQIFHPVFLVDDEGNHPDPHTQVSVEDVQQGRWRFNPALADVLDISVEYGQRHLEHYTSELARKEKFAYTVWPYHAMLGGLSHALVSAFAEAIFFHNIARRSRPDFEIKGHNPLTEHYSAVGPEVLTGPDGERIADKSEAFVEKLQTFDAVIIAGQAKSHCVNWTIDDILTDIRQRDEALAKKVYLLEDCTSPIVVPGVVDFTEAANEAFQRFAEAGMHVVRSTDHIDEWPDIEL